MLQQQDAGAQARAQVRSWAKDRRQAYHWGQTCPQVYAGAARRGQNIRMAMAMVGI